MTDIVRIGSLFSGYGGLDMGVQSAIGGTVAWHVEYDAAPSKILTHHWPDVPNYGDVTTVDWSAVEQVDVLTGGFPCQDLSLAGRRAGMRSGTRSGLWSDYLKAIDVIRPRLAVIENVRGLLSGCAESDMEPCPGCVGDGEHRPPLRALGRVLGDLADIGYDAEWLGLRAADAGAPHSRFRVFVAAHDRSRGRWQDDPRRCDLVGESGIQAGRYEGAGASGSDRDAASDTGRDESERRGELLYLGSSAPSDEGSRAERQWVRNPLIDRGATAPDSNGGRSEERLWNGGDEIVPVAGEHRSDGVGQWGDYTAAIERWEAVTCRRAPDATEPGDGGRNRLSARFVEWMMGLPAGHVTETGIARTGQLKALGNGVVPQQAALAISTLLGMERAA